MFGDMLKSAEKGLKQAGKAMESGATAVGKSMERGATEASLRAEIMMLERKVNDAIAAFGKEAYPLMDEGDDAGVKVIFEKHKATIDDVRKAGQGAGSAAPQPNAA